MHHRNLRWLIAILMVVSPCSFLTSGEGIADERPHAQQLTLSRPGTPVYVAIVGAIHRPGVYRFENRSPDHRNPTVADLVGKAGSLTANASGIIRIIRDQRSGLQIYYSPNNPTPLLDNDVVLIEDRSSGTHKSSISVMREFGPRSQSDTNQSVSNRQRMPSSSASETAPRGTGPSQKSHIVCVNLIDRPVVLPLREKHASLPAILSLLNQSMELSPEIRIIQPGSRRPDASDRFNSRQQNTGDENNASDVSPPVDTTFGDGTVVIFNPSYVDQSRIPELPPVISAANNTESAPTVPSTAAPDRRGGKTDLNSGDRSRPKPIINPSEPAPFPGEPSHRVDARPLGDSRTSPKPRLVEPLPSPQLSGPQLDFSADRTGNDEIQSVPDSESYSARQRFSNPVPPDIAPRALAERDGSENSRKRLTQKFGETLDIPDAAVPYHPETNTAARNNTKSGRKDSIAAEFADDVPATNLESGSSTMIWVLTSFGIAILLVGRVYWMVKPRIGVRRADSVSTSIPPTTPPEKCPVKSEPVRSAESLLTAILEKRYPVVHEPFPLGSPLTLNGRLDTERLLRIDSKHGLPAPVSRSHGFAASQREIPDAERPISMPPTSNKVSYTTHASHSPSEPISPQQDRRYVDPHQRRSDESHVSADAASIPVAVPVNRLAPTDVEQRQERTITRLIRITQADKQQARTRMDKRRMVQQSKRQNSVGVSSMAHTSQVQQLHVASATPIPSPHLQRLDDSQRSPMNREASVQEGRLDRALAHLQRERKS
ncbi:MAG: hypothetical protein O2955_02415 [Planctomycetota bacterium]|nr:hypothetical protein [Planctomycetota bacterium]MDA1211338.1 hypothetical protein [Planctomycetota bacterium]